MPRSIKKRAQKKESSQESIQHTLDQMREMAAERQKQIFIGVAAIALVGLVVLGSMYYRAGVERQVADLEYKGYKEFNALHVEVPEPPAVRAERAITFFRQARELRPSPFSQYYIGLCLYEMGQYAEAVNTFQSLVDTYPDEGSFVPPGLYKLGLSQLKAGQKEQALETFGRFRKVGIKAFGDLAILESARILESMGLNEEAVSMYETLLFEYPSSVFSAEARQKTAREDEAAPASTAGRPLVLLPEGEGQGQPLEIK
ncbi:MAG TPA: tetratricopeptide repeat protein [Nitrospirae bacterium]|nr:tetratricopeptide repeat protein [Nitrospirota bacterium]